MAGKETGSKTKEFAWKIAGYGVILGGLAVGAAVLL
jgi:hypothetical protein